MRSLLKIYERFGLGNLAREWGERYIKDFIEPGKFAEVWTELEKQYKDLDSRLKETFKKTNDLFKFIKPEAGDETYRISSLPEVAAQELNEYLDDVIKATDEAHEYIINKDIDYDTADKIIKYFDEMFEEMLNIFTSNSSPLDTLKPYRQSKIGFRTQNKKITERLQKLAGL